MGRGAGGEDEGRKTVRGDSGVGGREGVGALSSSQRRSKKNGRRGRSGGMGEEGGMNRERGGDGEWRHGVVKMGWRRIRREAWEGAGNGHGWRKGG